MFKDKPYEQKLEGEEVGYCPISILALTRIIKDV
jgi:hypothetical protein